MADSSLTGRLLVASPLIAEDTFHRTVVLVLTHEQDGALGVVLNRPTDMPATELVEGWGARAAAPGVVFDGGPVDRDTIVGLALTGAVDLQRAPEDAADAGEVRLFAGQAGWLRGQLEAEVGEQAWWVVDLEPEDVLTRDPSTLWERVLRRQPAPTSWFANLPEDLRTG